MDILNKILRLMFEKGIPQKQLADYLGLKNYQISEWKSGKTKSYMKYIGEIASFLGVSVDFLLNDDVSFETESETLDSKEAYDSHNIANRIKEVAKLRNITLKQMLVDLSLGSNAMSAMYHGKIIASDSLARIADYLDVSVDYLLGRTDIPEVNK